MPISKKVPREYPVAQIIELHDGDTWRLWIDQGFGGWQKEWIRLRGVNAEELSKPGGPEALAAAQEVVRLHAPEGWVRLTTFWTPGQYREIKEERTFIRYVGVVSTHDGVDLNAVLKSLIPEGGM